MIVHSLDQFLDLVDVRVDSFAVCEIGESYSLRCEPHDEVVVHFVLQGAGFLTCEHGEYPLSAGSIVLVPKKLPKCLRGAGPIQHFCDADAACALADGLVSFQAHGGKADLVLGCAHLSATLGEELPLFDQFKLPTVLRPEEKTSSALFRILLEELSHPQPGTRAFVGAIMKQLVVLLLRSPGHHATSFLLPTMNPRLARALSVVLSRPQDNHTVESLASQAGMSRSRFSHHFSAACLCSPKEFVQSVRLSSAAKLLKGSNLPIKSVAASVGYASRSHFSRAFHARYGLDPSSFRRTALSDVQSA